MEVFAGSSFIEKEIDLEKEEYFKEKEPSSFKEIDIQHPILLFKEFPYFISFHHYIYSNKTYLSKFNTIFNSSFQLKNNFKLKLLSYDKSFSILENIHDFDISTFTYSEYRKCFDIYYLFISAFQTFKSLFEDNFAISELTELFHGYENLFYGATKEENFTSIFRQEAHIEQIYKKSLQQNSLVKQHINKCLKALDKLNESYNNLLNYKKLFIIARIMDENSSVPYVKYRDLERKTCFEIINFNLDLQKIHEKIKNEEINPNLIDKFNREDKSGSNQLSFIKKIELFSNLQKEIGLTDKEISYILELCDSESDLYGGFSYSKIKYLIEQHKNILKILKIKNKELSKELLKDLLSDYSEDIDKLYIKYGDIVDDLVLNKNKETLDSLKDTFQNSLYTDNFKQINKIIPNLGTHLIKWIMTKEPSAWFFYQYIILPNFDFKKFKIICSVFPKLDINICKKEFKLIYLIIKNIYNNLDTIEGGEFTAYLPDILQSFRINNLNQLNNLINKIVVIARAMHNNGFYLTNDNHNVMMSFIRSNWEPSSDIISKFINLVFNEKLSDVFNKSEYGMPEFRLGKTENSSYIQEIAPKLKINLDDVRQKLTKYKMKFFAGEPISASEKTEVYDLSEKVNLLLSYYAIEKYDEKIENKVPELYKLNYQIDGFEFKVLPQGSYQHFQVGAATNCCQSIGGAGEDAAIDSYINSEAGVLVLSKDGQLIAQSYFHYVPKDNGYILDNVEVNDGNIEKYKVDIDKIYAKLAQYLKSRFKIKYFKCGKQYNSLDNKKFKTVKMKKDPRKFSVDEPYTDFDENDHIDLLSPNFN